MEDKLFTSVEEECLYWKERCLKVSQERDDAQREFDDFTTESRQLEAELEMTVEQQEKKIRDLNQLVNQLHSENESYKRKMQYSENETNKIDADFRQLAKENEKLKIYIRELEQKNDDLERANRVASESVAEFESMLNQAYEKNALLELEVDEKERMQIKLQRLMDEARDLKQELKVRTLKPDEHGEKLEDDELGEHGDGSSKQLDPSNESASTTTTIATANVTSAVGAPQQMNSVGLGGADGIDPDDGTLGGSKLETLNNNLNSSKQQRSALVSPMVKLSASKLNDFGRETTTPEDGIVGDGVKSTLLSSPSSQLIIERNGNSTPSSALVPGGLGGLNAPMAPSDRVSTLNIVADLLRRLDNMEAKLKAWKIRKPSSRTGPGSAGTVSSNVLTSLHTSHTISNLHHSAGTGGLMNSHNQHHPHHHHHHSNHHYQSQLQQQNHHADSNLSLNSLGSGDGTVLLASSANCCGATGNGSSSNAAVGNVQLHSYQPSTITIGTQTSQHLPATSLPTKTELLRTNK
ncbi:nuclear distribution protein nudE homolog 1 [Anopheles arabiensis]|uniref:NUDE domain-containing protein n=1 Tax=Anopheles arabiensis TaxID=7173 RepID=A0A182HRH3_ANOAR|nr:nuclear distribution protein nudE homolog 1 [Anopheles arabiensis]